MFACVYVCVTRPYARPQTHTPTTIQPRSDVEDAFVCRTYLDEPFVHERLDQVTTRLVHVCNCTGVCQNAFVYMRTPWYLSTNTNIRIWLQVLVTINDNTTFQTSSSVHVFRLRIHTHIHTPIYIYNYIPACMCVCGRFPCPRVRWCESQRPRVCLCVRANDCVYECVCADVCVCANVCMHVPEYMYVHRLARWSVRTVRDLSFPIGSDN